MKIKIYIWVFLIFSNCLHCEELNIPKNFKKVECSITAIKRSNNISSAPPEKLSATSGSKESFNWAGYVAANNLQNPRSKSVKYAVGSWVVPQLTSTTNSSCIIWVGMDGYKGSTIEQIGTAHEMRNGTQVNYAWFAMHPNNSFQITNFPIRVNDSIKASVSFIGNDLFKLTIINNTLQRFTTVPLSFTTSANALRNSAEWIVEADTPSFAKFNTIDFSKCKATINNVKKSISDFSNSEITMVLRSNVAACTINRFDRNTARAIPSTLSSLGKNFKVCWHHN